MNAQIRFYLCLTAAIGVLGGVLLTTGCREQKSTTPPSATGNAVAVVGGQVIAVEALQNEFARRSRQRPGALNDSNEARALLENLIRFEVLYAQACQTGFLDRPETQAALKRLVVAQYRESLATNPASPAQVSEAEVERYYQAQTHLYQVPEQVRAALIFLPLSSKATPEKEAETRQRAEAIRAQALAAAETETTFGLLAQTNSAHQPTRYRGGDLGWLTREAANRDWEPELRDALFNLAQISPISPVVHSRDGLYLFKLIERKPASLRPLAEVKDAIVYHLAREQAAQREEKLYAQLKAGVPIRINEATLARLLTNLPPAQTPPSLPSQ